MKTQKFKAAIFDLDGTLACTMPDLYACLNSMLERVGFPTHTKEEVLNYISCGERDYVRFALPIEYRDNEKVLDDCLRIYSGIYSEHYCDSTYLYDGITETLAKLRENGIWMAVHTNKAHAHACGMLEKLGVSGYFDEILGDGKYPSKPDPTGSLLLAKKAGFPPSEFCFIGDSDVDMHTAVNAGMFALGVTWGYRPKEMLIEAGANRLVDAPSEIADFILG